MENVITDILYPATRQKFVEVVSGSVVKADSFQVPERTQHILENDRVTVITLSDGSIGRALVAPGDVKNVTFGRKLAYLRAKKVSIEKEIDALIKSTHS